MGTKELREAANEILGPEGTCIKALLEYGRPGDVEFQFIYLSGNYADGTGFSIKSNGVRAGGDVILEARATAERLLEQKRKQ